MPRSKNGKGIKTMIHDEYAAALWYAMGRLDQLNSSDYGIMTVALVFAGRYEDSVKCGGNKSVYDQWETYAKELQSMVTVELGVEDA